MSTEATPAAPQPGQPAGTPAGNVQNQSTQQQQQVDYATYTKLQQDYQTAQRQAQQAAGMRPFVEKARGYGLSDEAALEKVGKFYQQATAKGLRLEQIAAMFDDEKTGPEQSDTISRAEMLKLMEERDEKIRKGIATETAQKEYERELLAELEALEDEKLYGGIAGEGASKEMIELMKHAAIGKYGTIRQPFGDDHPLKGRYGPAGKQGLETIQKWLKDTYTAMNAKKVLDMGKAVNKTPANPPAGNGASGGKPEANGPARGPGGVPTRAELEAMHQEILAKRSGRA